MKVYSSISELVGHTPLVQLQRFAAARGLKANLLAKVEYFNPAGSVKDRIACAMLDDAEQRGLLKPGAVIVEPTSGNQGIGLALIGAVRGYRVKIIMPDSVSVERRKLITHYGAEVILVHDAGNIGDAIEECRLTALKMAEEDPNVFIPGQFENPANPMVHKHHTALEILEQVAGPIHGFCSGVGTGGTISGIGESLKALNPDITVWAVEPEHAAILAGGNIGTHLQTGIGDGLIPDNLNRSIYSDICIISDEEAIEYILQAVKNAGYEPGKDFMIAMDAASSEWKGTKKGEYILPKAGTKFTSEELIEHWKKLVEKYPIISIEDALDEEDWEGWQKLTKELGDKVQLVGDDLFVTNTERLKKGIDSGCGNAILIKLNQIGSVSETLEAIKMAHKAGYTAISSHRSGETEDTTIADLAVALNTCQIKTGAPSRTERVAKYNQLLRIEEELGDAAVYPGMAAFNVKR